MPCPANRYQDEVGQVLCKACNPGTVSVNSGTSLSACQSGNQCVNCASQPCTPGTFQPSGGQSACVACSATQYQDGSGATACKSVSSGFYLVSPTAQAPCPVGTACSQGVQQPCPSGTFQSQPGRTACGAWSVCNPGFYSLAAGSSSADRTCATCPQGTFNPAANTLPACSPATICGVGQYQTSAATTTLDATCAGCPTGTYQDQVTTFDLPRLA